jgi:hypothetical protein
VSEGLLALAEDKRPEAKRFIGLNLHSLQRHNKTCQNLRWHSISWLLIKSMMQCRIANYGEAITDCNLKHYEDQTQLNCEYAELRVSR